jgi:hydrogenase maturation protease
MGDEGVGIHVIRHLGGNNLPPHVELVDGGTGGFHLLEYFEKYDRVVLVDASLDGRPPGTVRKLAPKLASDFPTSLTAHDIGLKDLLEAASLLDHNPEVLLVTISVRDVGSLGVELSHDVQAAIPGAVAAILEQLQDARK